MLVHFVVVVVVVVVTTIVVEAVVLLYNYTVLYCPYPYIPTENNSGSNKPGFSFSLQNILYNSSNVCTVRFISHALIWIHPYTDLCTITKRTKFSTRCA